MSRRDRVANGPSWAEVIFGAILSLVLGVVLGALLLVFRPVVTVKEEPKERDRGVVYYVEGARDPSKARQALAKRKAFTDGQSITITEEEINALIAPPPAAPGEKKEGEAAAGVSEYFKAGTPLVRVHDGMLQIGLPVTVDLLGARLVAQAQGTLVKQGDVFVFEPQTMHLGSCPVNRVPYLSTLVREKVLTTYPLPEDIKQAWGKLANATIEGKAVKLTMP